MHNASLNLGKVRIKTVVIASGNPLSPSTTAIRMSDTQRFLDLGDHSQPELRALALLDLDS